MIYLLVSVYPHGVLNALVAECVFSSEWNAFAQVTYAANFGDVPHGEFAVLLPPRSLPMTFSAEVFHVSRFRSQVYPKRRVLAESMDSMMREQGNLFFEILRIAQHHQPELLFLENVRNLVAHTIAGKLCKQLVMLLEAAGYQVSWQLYDAVRVCASAPRANHYRGLS